MNHLTESWSSLCATVTFTNDQHAMVKVASPLVASRDGLDVAQVEVTVVSTEVVVECRSSKPATSLDSSDKALFWKLCDALRSDSLRSSRRWRRLRMKEGGEDGVKTEDPKSDVP